MLNKLSKRNQKSLPWKITDATQQNWLRLALTRPDFLTYLIFEKKSSWYLKALKKSPGVKVLILGSLIWSRDIICLNILLHKKSFCVVKYVYKLCLSNIWETPILQKRYRRRNELKNFSRDCKESTLILIWLPLSHYTSKTSETNTQNADGQI